MSMRDEEVVIAGCGRSAASRHSLQGKQGRQAVLCYASPDRGGGLDGGFFVGEVVRGDSLSLATSSPARKHTHTDTHAHTDAEMRNREGPVCRNQICETKSTRLHDSHMWNRVCSIFTVAELIDTQHDLNKKPVLV